MDKSLLGLKGIKRTLAVLAVLTLIHSVSIIVLAQGLADAVSALFAGETLQEQANSIGLFLLAFIVRQASALLMQQIAYRYAEQTGRDLRRELMEKLFRYGPRLAKTEGTGNVVTMVLDGVAQYRNYIELILPRMLGMGITPILIWIYILLQDWIAAIILAVTIPILILFMILLGMAAKKQMDRQWQSYRVLSNHFVDSLRGLETLKVLGLSRSHSETIEWASDKYRTATMKTLRLAFLSSFALDIFTMLSVASVAVSLGLRLIEGTMLLPTALLVLILAPEYFLPVRMIGADYHATLKGKEAGQAIEQLIRESSKVSHESALPSGMRWTDESLLVMEEVGLKHEEHGPASLTSVSLRVQGLKKVGIIGASGAGKSTLIDVLGGFLRPTSGTIKLNQKQLGSLSDEAWQELVTYIPQHPYLFSTTLEENVRFYQPEANAEEVAKAVEAAGLKKLVEQLPEGMNTRIGNGGRVLSGGQEQRVALARAFLGDRPIMLLDEPTAHLDIETEYELKETMLSLFEHKLVFLATHRLHWMTDMDMIIVLQQGQVAEIGTHEELMNNRSVYYELVTTEMEGWQ